MPPVGVDVSIAVFEGVCVGVCVDVQVRVTVTVGVRVQVLVNVFVWVHVFVAVAVRVGVGVCAQTSPQANNNNTRSAKPFATRWNFSDIMVMSILSLVRSKHSAFSNQHTQLMMTTGTRPDHKSCVDCRFLRDHLNTIRNWRFERVCPPAVTLTCTT
jgi:hypothetical protein